MVRVHDGIGVVIAAKEDSLAVATVSSCQNRLLFGFLVGNIVVAEDIVDLLSAEFAPLARLAVVMVLVIHSAAECECRSITAAAPDVDKDHALRCRFTLVSAQDLADAVVIPEVIEYILVFALCISDLLHHIKLRVLLIDRSPEDRSAAPYIVPAIYPAGSCIIVENLVGVIEYGGIAGRSVQPCSSPAVIIFPLAGIIELTGAVAVVGERLFVGIGEIPQRLSIVKAFRCIFRIGVLEVEVVDCKRCTRRYDIIGLRLIGGQEVSRAHHRVNLGSLPDSMVDSAFADLIAVCNDRAVLVAEGTLHQIVVEVAENCFDVVVLMERNVGIAELIVAPSERCGSVVFRHTEFNVVAGIMHTAGNVNRAVAVRIEDVLIFVHECLRKVGAAAFYRIAVPGYHRDMRVVGVAVITP